MTILPKKKHSESKKSETTSNNESRTRIRGNSSWTSSASVTERGRSSEEYSSHEEQYLGNSFESREATDVASCSSKRRHRSPPHRHKYHERHSEETGYNSSDEHDTQTADQPLSSEEVHSSLYLYVYLGFSKELIAMSHFLSYFIKVERQFEQALKEKKGFIVKKMGQDGACLFRAVGT